MTPEERQMISGLFDRIRGAVNGPKDAEAEAFINENMRSTPAAGYVMAQTVLVQQQALEAASKRITELEQQAKEPPANQDGGGFLGNLGRSIFGSSPQTPPPPRNNYDARAYERQPEPAYGQRPGYAPPPPQGGPWGGQPQQGGGFGAPQGGGFLQGAMQTAAGVAGGVLIGNAIGGLFGGHGGGLFGGGSSAAFAAPRETVNETVNNYYETDPAGQRAQDYLQDQDQDQDFAQDNFDDSGSGGSDDWA